MWCSTHLGGWVPHRGVILFGSHASGGAGPHSDLDFLVIEPIVEAGGEESVRLRRTLRGRGIAADILVVSEREAEEWCHVRGASSTPRRPRAASSRPEGRPVKPRSDPTRRTHGDRTAGRSASTDGRARGQGRRQGLPLGGHDSISCGTSATQSSHRRRSSPQPRRTRRRSRMPTGR
jgi:GNAT superfamily N-acetyltransferase